MSLAEIPLQVITQADVRDSVKRAKKGLETAAAEIIWQIEREAWVTLGYSSWDAMREAEYGGAAFMVPRKNRPELVARMRAKGLTQQEIADTAGVAKATVQNDLKANSGFEPKVVTNSRGQQRPATYSRNETDVIDAEVVEDDDLQDTEDYWTDQADLDDSNKATDPAPAEPVVTVTCPTCNGEGKVTR